MTNKYVSLKMKIELEFGYSYVQTTNQNYKIIFKSFYLHAQDIIHLQKL